MLPNVGLPEFIVIALILLLVFGGSRLPKLGENLGRTVAKLKRSPGVAGKSATDSEDADIVE